MTSKARSIKLPFNRVEGDLEIRVEIRDGQVTEAWVCGSMFRGFENMMIGRGPLDGLVITPRICGICSTSHLHAAALALDSLSGVRVPGNATRLRNVTQIAEHLQSDLRHLFLMFAVDFAHPCYQSRSFFPAALARYAPLTGETAIEVVRQTRRILEVVAIIGGQWPHSSFMVPGGIVSVPSRADLRQCRHLARQFRGWFEERVLGGRLEHWQQLKSVNDLDAWCADSAKNTSELALLMRIGLELGLDKSGAGHGRYLSCGSLPLPAGEGEAEHLLAAGFLQQGQVHPWNSKQIAEDVSCSWFGGSAINSPMISETLPEIDKPGAAYSWVKAPRYRRQPAETGPLAELLVAGQPLVNDWVATRGESTLVRELARVARCAELLPVMERWLQEADDSGYYRHPGEIEAGTGIGLVQASRGALGHWLRIEDGRIAHYQIITPTAWNASPRDEKGVRGPLEEALIGTPVADEQHPIELGHIVRSFDPCLVCAVHTYRNGAARSRLRIGVLG
jgi:hydrogenase large subunit